ncbi:MAG TPA: hypothetical protein VK525_07215 [Candidatus Saccharimonadales bacterium]|nr:hypothetical protein [Candidatus Saccharimonadales bacterium]
MKTIARPIAAMLLWAALAALSDGRDDRLTLFPNFQKGQIFTYLVQFRADKDIKTESNVAAPLSPNGGHLDAHGLLRIEVLEARPQKNRTEIHARARFQSLNSGVLPRKPGERASKLPVEKQKPAEAAVEFTIRTNGLVEDVKDLETLAPEQQQAWREWATKFAIAGTFPKDGVKRGEKWDTATEEKSPSPVAGLSWTKNWQYVRDEPCRPAQISVTGEITDEEKLTEQCAVILSTAKLRQKSSAKNSSPEDYRLHELKTMGTAKGENEVIAYISLQTGLVVRATESAHQFMDVIVAKADDTNRVHYNVEAKSQSEVRLVTQIPLGNP